MYYKTAESVRDRSPIFAELLAEISPFVEMTRLWSIATFKRKNLLNLRETKLPIFGELPMILRLRSG